MPEAPSATPEAPEALAAAASSVSGPARLSMLLAADRQDGVEAGEMTEALTTVAWGLKQLGRTSGGMASISSARMSSACGTIYVDPSMKFVLKKSRNLQQSENVTEPVPWPGPEPSAPPGSSW